MTRVWVRPCPVESSALSDPSGLCNRAPERCAIVMGKPDQKVTVSWANPIKKCSVPFVLWRKDAERDSRQQARGDSHSEPGMNFRVISPPKPAAYLALFAELFGGRIVRAFPLRAPGRTCPRALRQAPWERRHGLGEPRQKKRARFDLCRKAAKTDLGRKRGGTLALSSA
jgi:hypothetical protein